MTENTPTPLPGLSADIVHSICRALGHDPARVTKVEIERGKMIVTSVHVHDLVESVPAPQSPEGTTDGGNEPDDDGEQPEPPRPPARRRQTSPRKAKQ